MSSEGREREQGFLLVGLIVAIFLILLALSVAAPKLARGLQREREVETVHRGNQYVRAIQLYYRKFAHYPGSMEQLAKSNNIRFLRQDYVDPMTGKSDWRIIKVGEAKTTVKGFFGKPLAGLPAGGMGSPGGMGSGAAGSSAPTSGFGASGASSGPSGMGSSGGSTGFSLGPSSFSSPSSTSAAPGAGTSPDASSANGAPGGLSSSFGASGSTGPFVGVGLPKEGDSIIVLNEQTTYNTWEFIYDPRIEQLKAKGAMMSGASSSGTGSNSTSGFGSSTFGGSNNTNGGIGGSPSPSSNGSGSTPSPNPQ